MEVGIVGKPNVGKSTFFKSLTLKDAEVANFPFTTIDANVGVGYVKSRCPEEEFEVCCSPKNSTCRKGNRFIPVKMIDVAGLVPGAHEGKGLGNQFLDDLRRADALIHVVDISGSTNDVGEPVEDYDPAKDIRFLQKEIDAWFVQILDRSWSKVTQRIKHEQKDPVKEFSGQLAGLGIKEEHIVDSLREADLEKGSKWDDEDKELFAKTLRKHSKPILIAGNKIDLGKEHYERLKEEYNIIPVCSEAELALKQADKEGLISYVAGESSFEIEKGLSKKQENALNFIKENILETYGSTGVQDALNKAVFDLLKRIVVYPVENENSLCDAKGNILPDAYLMPEGSTVLDLAYKVHSDIGDNFIGAIDCRSKMKVGKDHQLKDQDVINILTSK